MRNLRRDQRHTLSTAGSIALDAAPPVAARRRTLAALGAGSLGLLLYGCGGVDATPSATASSATGSQSAPPVTTPPATSTPTPTPPRVFTLDANEMLKAKQLVAAGNPTLQTSWSALLASANAALQLTPFSVVDKNMVPPSGDKHDYLSLAPYWWPDPSKPNGLPYIQRDGQINPSSKNNDSDSVRMQAFCSAIGTLTTAWFLSGDARYADKAASLLRTWFIDPTTRMNPNLNYGQGIPGITTGRGIGIIDTRNFWQITDGIGLLASSNALSASDQSALNLWFADYLNWLLTSSNGTDEAAAPNNHGTFYDAQVTNLALFTSDTATAQNALNHALTKLLPTQFDKTGKEPLELSRTRPFHYSVFNLVAFLRLAKYGAAANVDIAHASAVAGSPQSLQASVAFLAPYVANPSSWPYQDLTGIEYDGDGNEFDGVLPVLQQAVLLYGATPQLTAALDAVRSHLPDAVSWLQWPITTTS